MVGRILYLMERIKNSKLIKIIVAVLVIIVCFITYKKIAFLSNEKERLASTLDTLQGTPANRTADEKKILDKVSKLIVLPENEQPTLFTILNADALTKEQPFFAGSVNGDVLLVYRQSQKAIIYSPTNRKIVNSGPIISSLQTQNSKSDATSTQVPVPAKKK